MCVQTRSIFSINENTQLMEQQQQQQQQQHQSHDDNDVATQSTTEAVLRQPHIIQSTLTLTLPSSQTHLSDFVPPPYLVVEVDDSLETFRMKEQEYCENKRHNTTVLFQRGCDLQYYIICQTSLLMVKMLGVGIISLVVGFCLML